MPERSSIPLDVSGFRRALLGIARGVVAQVTGRVATERSERPGGERQPRKNPAAVALGRLGGLKGGKARAAKLSAARRRAIARAAARARWQRARPPR